MAVHLPRPVFLPLALLYVAALHLLLSRCLASSADVAAGVSVHFVIAAFYFVWFGLCQDGPYGRYAATGVVGRAVGEGGVTACNRLCWMLMEAPAFIATAAALVRSGRSPASDPGAVLAVLFAAHYFQRSFVFPLLLRSRRPFAVYVYLTAAAYCCFNGHLMSLALLSTPQMPDQDHWQDPCFVVGVCLFLFGMGANIHADQHLRSLRSDARDTGYKIPQAGLFRWVSGANFLAEIVEWGGFALAARHQAAVAFWLAVVGNLGPRALSHHKWYCEKFGEPYRSLRRAALVPFLL